MGIDSAVWKLLSLSRQSCGIKTNGEVWASLLVSLLAMNRSWMIQSIGAYETLQMGSFSERRSGTGSAHRSDRDYKTAFYFSALSQRCGLMRQTRRNLPLQQSMPRLRPSYPNNRFVYIEGTTVLAFHG
jgi:hypothetical protein